MGAMRRPLLQLSPMPLRVVRGSALSPLPHARRGSLGSEHACTEARLLIANLSWLHTSREFPRSCAGKQGAKRIPEGHPCNITAGLAKRSTTS